MKTTIDVYIFVFEDYGIATLQVGSNIDETARAVEALSKKCVARYLLQIKSEVEINPATKAPLP